MPSAPEPANRSRTSAPSMLGPTMLKSACFTMPWVGRMFFGALRRRPRASPPATRSFDTLGVNADLAVVPHHANPDRRPHRVLEPRGVGWRYRDQQSPAGLRVAQHHLVELRHALPVDLAAISGMVAAAPVREKVALGEVPDAGHERD